VIPPTCGLNTQSSWMMLASASTSPLSQASLYAAMIDMGTAKAVDA
jgi:hypothetical protein